MPYNSRLVSYHTQEAEKAPFKSLHIIHFHHCPLLLQKAPHPFGFPSNLLTLRSPELISKAELFFERGKGCLSHSMCSRRGGKGEGRATIKSLSTRDKLDTQTSVNDHPQQWNNLTQGDQVGWGAVKNS